MAIQLHKIASVDLTSGTGGVAFTSIPQGYTDIILRFSMRTSYSGTDAFLLYVNGSGTGKVKNLIATGNNTYEGYNQTTMYLSSTFGNYTANTFNNGYLYFPNYSNSTTYKGFKGEIAVENNATANYLTMLTGLVQSNTAISSLGLYNGSSGLGFAQYSTATLYGIL